MVKIDKNILKDIEEYCLINNINDIEKEVNNLLKKGFLIEKYGVSPFITDISISDKKEIDDNKNDNDVDSDEKKVVEKVSKPKKKVRIIKNN